jgi:hypothetical protein
VGGPRLLALGEIYGIDFSIARIADRPSEKEHSSKEGLAPTQSDDLLPVVNRDAMQSVEVQDDRKRWTVNLSHCLRDSSSLVVVILPMIVPRNNVVRAPPRILVQAICTLLT